MEANLLFVVHLYNDDRYFLQLFNQIRQFYPSSLIIAIGDGVKVPKLDSRTITVSGERLKNQLGTAWSLRWMRLAQQIKATHIIKLDADSQMHRAFRFFPLGDIAGTLTHQARQNLTIVRGGCVMYRPATIERILDSGILGDRCYTTIRYGYYRYRDFAFPDEENNDDLIHCEDSVIGHVAKRMQLRLANWEDVRIEWRDPVPNGDFAVTHPARG